MVGGSRIENCNSGRQFDGNDGFRNGGCSGGVQGSMCRECRLIGFYQAEVDILSLYSVLDDSGQRRDQDLSNIPLDLLKAP